MAATSPSKRENHMDGSNEQRDPKKQKFDNNIQEVHDSNSPESVSSKNESANAGAKIEHSQRRRGKRLKYAMLLSYSGRAYYGMQIQKQVELPTIEKHILDALLELRLIDEKERAKPKLFWFQRAARTDKGVSALRQVCSMILPLREKDNDGGGGASREGGRSEDGGECGLSNAGNGEGRVTAGSKDDYNQDRGYSLITLVDAMNARLPDDIRVIGIRRATRTFDAKKACESRTYAYTLPSYAFSKPDEDTSTFRISDERLSEVNEILSLYEGTHNYFNFTCRRPATDPSCKRYIIRCQCGKPFMRDGMEFLTVDLTGQSFMLHQIRKMIGLCIAIVRGFTDKSAFEHAWEPVRFDVPIAPSLGLVLDEVHYDYYNKKFEKTHEPLDFSEFQSKIQAFRERFIDSVIVEMEKNEQTMLRWLDSLKCHDFNASSVSSKNDMGAETKVQKDFPNDEDDDGCASD